MVPIGATIGCPARYLKTMVGENVEKIGNRGARAEYDTIISIA